MPGDVELDGGDDHGADDIVRPVEPERSDPGRSRWGTLAAFAVVAFPLNLVFGALILRFSMIEPLSGSAGPESGRAVVEVLGQLRAWPLELLRGDGLAVTALAAASVFLASQLAFLVPWASWRPEIGTGPGWPLGLSAASAGLVGATLAVGLAYGLGEALVQVMITGLPRDAWGNQAVDVLDRGPIAAVGPVSTQWLLVAPLLGLVPLWILCGTLLARVTADADPIRPEVQLRRLLAGSVASIVLMIPFDALAKRRGACVCTTGTWIALCIGFLALLWIAGPAVVLLLNRRTRLEWRREACVACGYPRRGRAGDRCSECGTPHSGDGARG